MQSKPIVIYPDENLRKKSVTVDSITDATSKLIDEMLYTMHHAGGIGLAAPQVDIHQRIIVLKDENGKEHIFINPEIVERKDNFKGREGCLSIPNVFEEVNRSAVIKITALNRDGKAITTTAENMMAVIVQHEIDHLDGILFIDRLSNLKKQRALKSLELPEYPYIKR